MSKDGVNVAKITDYGLCRDFGRITRTINLPTNILHPNLLTRPKIMNQKTDMFMFANLILECFCILNKKDHKIFWYILLRTPRGAPRSKIVRTINESYFSEQKRSELIGLNYVKLQTQTPQHDLYKFLLRLFNGVEYESEKYKERIGDTEYTKIKEFMEQNMGDSIIGDVLINLYLGRVLDKKEGDNITYTDINHDDGPWI